MAKDTKHQLYKAATRLGNSFRFANLKLDKPYTGAEHSFRVAILAMLIVDDYNNLNPKTPINVEEVLRKALIHDLEESKLGDIPTPVKNRSAQFKEAYMALGKEIMKDEIVAGSPNEELYLKLWVEDKKGLTGEVIKVADALEALSTAHYEIRRGNLSIKRAFLNLKASVQTPEMMALFEKFPYAKSFCDKHTWFPKHIEKLLLESDDHDF